MTLPRLCADVDRHVEHVHPADLLPGRDHLLAVELPDRRHTHLDWPEGPAVIGVHHVEARHVTVVALLAHGGELARELDDDALVTVYRSAR